MRTQATQHCDQNNKAADERSGIKAHRLDGGGVAQEFGMNISRRSKGRAFAVKVLQTLEAPMRSSQEPSYRSLDGLRADKDAVLWYWRVTAVASSVMILGGYVLIYARSCCCL